MNNPEVSSAEYWLTSLRLTTSILYQRGIYPPEDFKMVKKYGLTLFTSADESLESYIQSVMKQVNGERQSTARAPMKRETALNGPMIS